MRIRDLPWGFLLFGLVTGCRSQRTYDAKVKIERVDAAHVDPRGNVQALDIQFEWESCPGRQMEVIRAGEQFAACIGKLTPGSVVDVKVTWHWENAEAAYDWDVTEMGGCKRPFEESDDASFDEVHACRDVVQHGEIIGFVCDRTPDPELIARCPWFRRR